MTHEVTKRLTTAMGVLEPGTLVDASDWRNTRLLEEQRYLRRIQPDGHKQQAIKVNRKQGD